MLQTEKEAVLSQVKKVFDEEPKVSEDFYKELDIEREKNLRAETPSFSWDEVKKRLLEKHELCESRVE